MTGLAKIVRVALTEPQAAFVSDACLLMAAIVYNDKEGQDKMANIAAQALIHGSYNKDDIKDVMDKITSIANTFILNDKPDDISG